MHTRLWERDPALRGMPAAFAPVEHRGPLDELSPEFPLRLTTVRRLDSYNSGVQTGGYSSPLRRDEALCVDPADAAAHGLVDGERVRVISRRRGESRHPSASTPPPARGSRSSRRTSPSRSTST